MVRWIWHLWIAKRKLIWKILLNSVGFSWNFQILSIKQRELFKNLSRSCLYISSFSITTNRSRLNRTLKSDIYVLWDQICILSNPKALQKSDSVLQKVLMILIRYFSETMKKYIIIVIRFKALFRYFQLMCSSPELLPYEIQFYLYEPLIQNPISFSIFPWNV